MGGWTSIKPDLSLRWMSIVKSRRCMLSRLSAFKTEDTSAWCLGWRRLCMASSKLPGRWRRRLMHSSFEQVSPDVQPIHLMYNQLEHLHIRGERTTHLDSPVCSSSVVGWRIASPSRLRATQIRNFLLTKIMSRWMLCCIYRKLGWSLMWLFNSRLNICFSVGLTGFMNKPLKTKWHAGLHILR